MRPLYIDDIEYPRETRYLYDATEKRHATCKATGVGIKATKRELLTFLACPEFQRLNVRHKTRTRYNILPEEILKSYSLFTN